MPIHSENRVLPYTPQQLFTIVQDIEKYPEFLPWVAAARILERHEDGAVAELVIKFAAFRGSYVSNVSFVQPGKSRDAKEWAIYVDLVKGPFTHLENRWVFHLAADGNCNLEFYLDFSFNSAMLEKMMGGMFDKAVHKMVQAFENRAETLYS